MGTRARLIALTLASYLFYGWWDWRFTGLMLVSTLIDYLAGHRIHTAPDPATRRLWLLVSVGANLGLLGFFKYTGFAARTANALLAAAGAGAGSGGLLPVPEIVLPVGISFYTFQTMSYSLDIYRGHARPTEGFWQFAAFVSLFPQLIAGPIVRYQDLDDQLRDLHGRIDWPGFRLGLQMLVVGLAKKLMLADPLGRWVDGLLAMPAALDPVTTWLVMLGYAFQIYFDFSGYSDMAVGLGRMLGFRFPRNFDSPYRAVDISDFWRRWHITLSTWLRDYLYVPLGGSRGSQLATVRNLVLTMFLGGLWHGAEWTFVCWGLYHGLLLGTCHAWKRLSSVRLPRPLAIATTFLAVLMGWVLFRARSLDEAGLIFARLAFAAGPPPAWPTAHAAALGDLATAALVALFAPNSWQLPLSGSRLQAVAFALAFVVCVTLLRQESPFLYFQF